MMQRLGWLCVAVGWGMLSSAYAIPIDAVKIASELKMSPDVVRVRLSQLGRVLSIKGPGLALSLAKKPELGNVIAEEWMVDCRESMIYQPSTGKSRKIPRSGILIESMSGILSLNDRHFREQMVIYPNDLSSPYDSSVRDNKQCLVVNHIHVEKYLESVVNGEFNSQWAENAVQAQIIAARTYALYQMREMRKDRGRVYDVESTQKDQVYLGLDREDPKAEKLVAQTRGMILASTTRGFSKKRENEPIKAFYHATCGGGTVLPQAVWGRPFAGFSKKVVCPYCASSPSFAWEHQMSLPEIESKVLRGVSVDTANRKVWPAKFLNSPSKWELVNLLAKKTIDSHVQNLVFEFRSRFRTKDKLNVSMNAYQARNWLDPSRLKSTSFSVEREGDQILFRGHGSGHGVGLCQWGAKKMGEKGFSFVQILSHYYPGVKLFRAWD